MKILSISDVITNSSSEVFIIHSKPEFQDEINKEIPKFLEKLCKVVGEDLHTIMTFEISDKTEIDEDWLYYKAKNDLLIHSAEENSIPYWLINVISDLISIPKFKDKFSGYYAKDLGEINLPYYDWNSGEEKTKLTEIQSIQRIHLG